MHNKNKSSLSPEQERSSDNLDNQSTKSSGDNQYDSIEEMQEGDNQKLNNQKGKNNNDSQPLESQNIDQDSELSDNQRQVDNQPLHNKESRLKGEDSSKGILITEMTKLNEELNDSLLRIRAEFDNFKKRIEREKSELHMNTAANCISKILPVIDNFERALDCETTDQNFKQGMILIMNQLNNVMDQMGVKVVDAKGKTFDPRFHNAVSHLSDPNFDDNTIIEVLQKGYQIGDKIIRPAMVKVAN